MCKGTIGWFKNVQNNITYPPCSAQKSEQNINVFFLNSLYIYHFHIIFIYCFGKLWEAAVPSSTCTRPKASTVLIKKPTRKKTEKKRGKNSDCSDCGNMSRYLQIFCDSEKTLKSPSKSSIRTPEFLLSTGVLWVLTFSAT